MRVLREKMDKLRERAPDMKFHEILRESRDTMGLMQYRTAEFLGLQIARLKNLETGYFRQALPITQLDRICEFFELDKEMMYKKMYQHLDGVEKAKKVRTLHRGKSEMQDMPADEGSEG